MKPKQNEEKGRRYLQMNRQQGLISKINKHLTQLYVKNKKKTPIEKQA